MLQKPLLLLFAFLECYLFAFLSPTWFGVFIVVITLYLLGLLWVYRRIYLPWELYPWLLLLLGIYVYYRCWENSFLLWEIPIFNGIAWLDLLLIPWFLFLVIFSRLRSPIERFYLFLALIGLNSMPALLPRELMEPLHKVSIGTPMLLGFSLLPWIGVLWGKWKVPSRLQSFLKSKRVRGVTKRMRARFQLIETDDPIENKSEDWLGFSELSQGLCNNLETLDLRRSSLSVGIIASWGKGKSSFINLLREQVRKEGSVIITFNPRASKSVALIQEDFFDVFAEELSHHYLGFRLLLARYTKHIGLLNQYESTRPLGSLLTLLLPGKEQEAVNRALRELGRRVYVFLDDLDRLSAEEILELLKLIDRNASFSNTVFITAYDKAYVNNVLRKHLDHGLYHCFIDKYISWEVPLPEPNKETLKQLVSVLLSRKGLLGFSELYGPVQRGWNKVAGIVMESLDSVRDLKRYLNLMIPRYQEIALRVDFEDYCLLYLLCYKDLGVFVALHSRRLLQLDTSSGSYVLAPNIEEELKQVSQWEGSKRILEKLFPFKEGDEEWVYSPSSLRIEGQFDLYFGALKKEDSTPFADAVSKIISSQQKEDIYMEIENVILELGQDLVTDAFLYLVKSSLVSGEDRAKTIELMAYVAFKPSCRNGGVNLLRDELLEQLSRDRYIKYEEFGIVQDLDGYRQLLERMLSFMSQKHPFLMSNLIDRVAFWDDDPFRECVYSIDEISAILLKCQDNYYNEWIPSASKCNLALQFILKEYMSSSPQYGKQALQRLVSLIRKYPDGCIWMILSHTYGGSYDKAVFSLSINISLLNLLETEGFSLDEWKGLIKDRRRRYLLRYARSTPRTEPFWHIELLSDEEVDLDSIDYIYRAVLAQVKKERQQASSEG